MKQTIFQCLILLSTLFINFNCLAQQAKKEYKTAAASEYEHFDTSQTLSDVIPAARKFKTPDMLRILVSGTPKQIKLTEYDYLTINYVNDGKDVAWGINAIHEAKIAGGRLVAPKATSYSILNMPAPPLEQGWSYNPSAYRKDHIKISEVKGEEVFAIDFTNYSLYLTPTGQLIKENSFAKYFYNEKGDCVRVAVNGENRQFRYFYKYDSHGNWTQRFVWDSDNGITQKIDRVITY